MICKRLVSVSRAPREGQHACGGSKAHDPHLENILWIKTREGVWRLAFRPMRQESSAVKRGLETNKSDQAQFEENLHLFTVISQVRHLHKESLVPSCACVYCLRAKEGQNGGMGQPSKLHDKIANGWSPLACNANFAVHGYHSSFHSDGAPTSKPGLWRKAQSR